MTLGSEEAETLALKAAAHLFADEKALAGFLSATGVKPEGLRDALSDRDFLLGILDYLLDREPLLIAFCEAAGVAPESPGHARAVLGGGREAERGGA
jgi:hypothetical protein